MQSKRECRHQIKGSTSGDEPPCDEDGQWILALPQMLEEVVCADEAPGGVATRKCGDEQAANSHGTCPHPSHRLSADGEGLVWCRLCGSWSGGVYRALKSKCRESPKTGLQRLCLCRIAKGLKPPSLDHVHSKAQARNAESLFVIGLDASSDG